MDRFGPRAEVLFSFVTNLGIADKRSSQVAGDVATLMVKVFAPGACLNRQDNREIEVIVGLGWIQPDCLAEQVRRGVQFAKLESRPPLSIKPERLGILVHGCLQSRYLFRRENRGWTRYRAGKSRRHRRRT